MMKKWIIFNLRIPGFHRWDNAPVRFGYLGDWHRHEFHITCELRVKNNRDLEIIDLKNDLFEFLKSAYPYRCMDKEKMPLVYDSHIVLKGDGSCENLAEQISEYMLESYEVDNRVTVLEDGENGARHES